MIYVPFSETEAHGIICAAMFIDHDTISDSARNEIATALIKQNKATAMRIAIIKLANYKQEHQGHDRPDIVADFDYRVMAEAILNDTNVCDDDDPDCH
jgi:hypothetical protein